MKNIERNGLKEILLLGLGNYILSDEGVGIHVVKMIEQNNTLPDYVDVMDGGTGGYFLLKDLCEYKSVIIIDASLDECPDGTVRVINPRYSSDFPPLLSAHEFGLKQLVDALYVMDYVPDIYLVIVSVSHFQEIGIELSIPVRGAIADIRKAIDKLIPSIVSKHKVYDRYEKVE